MAAVLLLLIPIAVGALIIVISWKQIMEITIMIFRSYFNLYKLPGPKAYPLLGAVWDFKLDTADLMEQIFKWYALYGYNEGDPGLIKLWIGPLPSLIILKPDYCKTIMESNTLITKAVQYDKLSEWIGTGLLTSTNEKWFSRRKILTPAFHFSVLKGYGEIFVRQGKILLEQTDKFCDTDREVDLFPFIKCCALDIICETAMATQINSQTGKNSEYVDAVLKLSDIIFNHLRSPWLWFKPIWYASGVGFKFDRLVKLTNDFTKKVIEERRKVFNDNDEMEDFNTNNKKIFLDLLLHMQKSENLSDEDIREEVDTFMFEGHDTTSSGMAFTVWLLGQFPDYQARLHSEMNEVFGYSMRDPTETDLKKCKFLEQCIKESLRLCPPVPFIARRLTHDLVLDEYVLPKNLTVFMSLLGVHRHPTYWEKPNNFYPEHFDSENVSRRHPFAFSPFSAGPRNCIGQKFALAEEKTILSWFFRKYKVETVEPMPGNRFIPELILKPEDGVKCRIYKRISTPS